MAKSTPPPSVRDGAVHAAGLPAPPATRARDPVCAADELHWLRLICQLNDYEVAGMTADDVARAARGIGQP